MHAGHVFIPAPTKTLLNEKQSYAGEVRSILEPYHDRHHLEQPRPSPQAQIHRRVHSGEPPPPNNGVLR